MLAICARDAVPRMLSAEQDRRMAQLCSNPALHLPKAIMEFMVKEVFDIDGNAAHRGRSTKRSEQIKQRVEDPSVQAMLANYIHAGYTVGHDKIR